MALQSHRQNPAEGFAKGSLRTLRKHPLTNTLSQFTVSGACKSKRLSCSYCPASLAITRIVVTITSRCRTRSNGMPDQSATCFCCKSLGTTRIYETLYQWTCLKTHLTHNMYVEIFVQALVTRQAMAQGRLSIPSNCRDLSGSHHIERRRVLQFKNTKTHPFTPNKTKHRANLQNFAAERV